MKPELKSREDYFRRYLDHSPIAMAFWRSAECYRFSKEKLVHPVLDVGCGDGFLVRAAFGEQMEAGIDLDPEEVRRAVESGSYKKALCASATDLPFKNQTFKTAISNCVLEHIPDIDTTLKEIRRVLKPKGRLIFTVPSEHYTNSSFFRGLLTRMGLPGLGKFYIDRLNGLFRHQHVEDAKIWEKRLAKCGFKMEKADYIIPLKAFHAYERWMPAAVPSKILWKYTGRWVFGPRGPVKWFASHWFRPLLEDNGGPGACYFIIARKK